MCLAPKRPKVEAPPPAPPAPPPPPPPPPPAPPPAPLPPPESAGQKVATIKRSASVRGPQDDGKGAAAMRRPRAPIPTITGQATGINVPGASQ
jgi:hypothetical protein